MASKTKSSKGTRKRTTSSQASSHARLNRGAVALHKLQGDPQRLLKVEWSVDHKDFVAQPVSLQEAVHITGAAKVPFCKKTIDDPTKKYYCEFSVQDNQYICTLVDADDPRCR